MKIILATSNKGKVREFKKMCDTEVIAFSDILGDIEIVEDGNTFKENALIKARTIYKKLNDTNVIVVSDDSGISVPLLGGTPGVYSARYAGEGASDKDNLYKLVNAVKEAGVDRTPAYYIASIAIVSKFGEYVVHGWMHGDVLATTRGDHGFGYDPMFVPSGFEQTLGELDDDVKKSISHRGKALSLAKPIIEMIQGKK